MKHFSTAVFVSTILLAIVSISLFCSSCEATATVSHDNNDDNNKHNPHVHDHLHMMPEKETDPEKNTRRLKHRCIHDDPLHQQIIKKHLAETPRTPSTSKSNRNANPEALAGLRVIYSDADLNISSKYCTQAGDVRPSYSGSTITCRAEDILTDTKRTILTTKVLPAALGLIKQMIAMESLTTPIVMPTSACNGLGYTIPASHTTSGVSGADYVLYVSATRTPTGVLAFAGGCGYDDAGRLVYGRANFGPEYLTWSDSNPAANDDLVKTAVHEIWHALGYSHSVFSATSGLVATVADVRGKSTKVHQGSYTVAAAREFYDCSSLTGIELEDEGGSGSALSHIDKRIARQDFMAASGGTLLSLISIAMLCDLGFYTPLYSQIQNSTFGRNAGCTFLTDKCNVNSGGRDKYFCFDGTQVDVCAYDFAGSGFCGISQYGADLPSYFQYFSGEPRKGGNRFLDMCPIVEVYSNRVCNMERQASHGDYILGHTFTRQSRCFRTSGVVRSGYGNSNVGETRCLVSRCIDDGGGGKKVQFKVNGSSWVECSAEGQSLGDLPGYQGSVVCPQSFSSFCTYYDIVPAPPDGFPDEYTGSTGGSNDDPYGQVPTNTGAIIWIEGQLILSGVGWASMNGTEPEASIITSLQRDIAVLLALTVREVFISFAVIEQSSPGSSSKVLRIKYFTTNTDQTVETVRSRFANVQTQNSTAWLSRTRNEYQSYSGATDSPMLDSYNAEYKLSFLERLFLNLGVGPFSGIVVAAFIFVCLVVAIFFCFCKDSCCGDKEDEEYDDNFEDVRNKKHRQQRGDPGSNQHRQSVGGNPRNYATAKSRPVKSYNVHNVYP